MNCFYTWKSDSSKMAKYFSVGFSFPCFLLAIKFFFITEVSAQKSFYDSVLSANELIYRFKFQSADSSIQKLTESHRQDYLPRLLDANYYWWQIISGHDTTETRNKYYQNLDKSLFLLESEKRTDYSNDTLYALITTFAFKSRIHSMNYEYFSALAQLNNSIEFVKKSFGKEKDYEWFYLTSGVYDFYIEAVKKNYPFLLPYLIFLPEGDMVKGISYLEHASKSENAILMTEANYFLMRIYLDEEKNYILAGKYAEILTEDFPENLLYRYYQFKIFLKQNNIDQAAKELGMLKYYAEKNPQITEKQKNHFQIIARKDLQEYYLKKNNKTRF